MPTNNAINNQVGNGFISKKFILTPAQVIGAFATPVQLIPAPGAGKIALIYQADIFLNFNSVAYTGGGTPVLFPTTLSNGVPFSTTTITASAKTWQGAQQVGPGISHVNQAWNFTNQTGAFANGDSNLHIHLFYRIWSVT